MDLIRKSPSMFVLLVLATDIASGRSLQPLRPVQAVPEPAQVVLASGQVVFAIAPVVLAPVPAAPASVVPALAKSKPVPAVPALSVSMPAMPAPAALARSVPIPASWLGAIPRLDGAKSSVGKKTLAATTTVDPMDEFCKEACEQGVGGPECDCADHPIG